MRETIIFAEMFFFVRKKTGQMQVPKNSSGTFPKRIQFFLSEEKRTVSSLIIRALT